MSSLESSVVGAVLAGGASRRLGRDKALLPWSGKALLLHPYEALRQVIAEVVVVTVPGRSYRELAVPVVHDRFAGQGPLAGIHAALEWAGARPVFVAACDLPCIRAELVDYVAGWSSGQEAFAAWCGDPRPRARIAVWEGRRQPLFGLYSATCRSALEASLRAGRLEARSFLDEIDTTAVGITPDLDFYRPDLLLNVNSAADLPRSSLQERALLLDR